MCDKAEFKLCRLCLNSRGLLINVFGENSKLQCMLENTIEDLIDVKVLEDNYPWLVCSTCMEKLTEFRLFKRRCSESLSVFYNRIQNRGNPAAKDWTNNQEEKVFCDDSIVSDANDKGAVDVPDDMIIVKEEFSATSECSASPVRDIESLMVTSMQEGCSHWSDNEEAGNLEHLQDDKLRLSFNEEVIIKEEWNVHVPEEEGGPGREVLQLQDYSQGQDCVGSILHICQICNKRFAQKDTLEAHIMLQHPVQAEKIRSGSDAEAFECRSDVAADGMTYKCAICFKAFSAKKTLKRHMVTHSVEKRHKCEICLKGFNYKESLMSHKSLHTGRRPHKCEICEKTFNRKQNLKDHIRRHMGERPFKCEVCSKAFPLKQKLVEHKLTHSGEKPHKCEECEKAFTQKANLRRHMLTHSGERPFKCETCARGFLQKIHLEYHTLTHTGEKPHQCEVCLKTFTLKQTLKIHMYTHTMQKPH